MFVRPANKTDFDSLYEIERLAFPTWLQWPQLDLAAELNQHVNYVVTDISNDNKPIGFIMLDTQYPAGPYISNVAVLPKYQGMGVGKLLLDTVEDFCRANGEQSIVLHVHTENPAQVIYFNRGYRVEGLEKKFYKRAEEGMQDGIFMRKIL